MHSIENARKPQFCPVSLSQSVAKRRKINRSWWWSGYTSIPIFMLFYPCLHKKMPRNLSEWADRLTEIGWSVIRVMVSGSIGQSVRQTDRWTNRRTDGQKDSQPENIMPLVPKSRCMIIFNRNYVKKSHIFFLMLINTSSPWWLPSDFRMKWVKIFRAIIQSSLSHSKPLAYLWTIWLCLQSCTQLYSCQTIQDIKWWMQLATWLFKGYNLQRTILPYGQVDFINFP